MKRLFAFMFCLVLTGITTLSSAAASFAKAMQGKWYDGNNKLACVIDANTINGYRLVYFEGIAGGAMQARVEFTVLMDKEVCRFPAYYNAHGKVKMLTIHNRNVHSEPTAPFESSIGGIHLGMTFKEVVTQCGLAPMRRRADSGIIWYYPDDNWAILFEQGVVSKIALPVGSTKTFDESGLTAESSAQEFKAAYNDSSEVMDRINVSKGEYIWLNRSSNSSWLNVFAEPYIELSIYGF